MQINKAKHIGKWGKIYYCAFTRHLQVWTFLGRVLAEMLVLSTVTPDGQATVNILVCCNWFLIISNLWMPNIACIEPFMTYEGDEIAPETKKGSSNNWKMNPIECMKACQFHSRYVRGLLLWVLSLHFDLIKSDLQKSTTNQFDCRCHFWFFKPSAFSCKLLGKNGNSKRLKKFHAWPW